MKCPICDETSPPKGANLHHPFCSKRCKWVDLGKWLGGEYAIAGDPAPHHPRVLAAQHADEDRSF